MQIEEQEQAKGEMPENIVDLVATKTTKQCFGIGMAVSAACSPWSGPAGWYGWGYGAPAWGWGAYLRRRFGELLRPLGQCGILRNKGGLG
jgi:hypothetical protein